ncbi:MAG: hypothetical protein J6N51_17065 [Selenomonas sp.]|nr:hypothetical protein [Selenomonas sp.]
MSLQEYNVDITRFEEWIPWGGLTLPFAIENKDGSFVAIMEYEPYPYDAPALPLPEFPRGWAIWVERQHFARESKDYIVFSWNPFKLNTGRVKNTLGKPIKSQDCRRYFGKELKRLEEQIGKITKVRLLEYQELLDFLSFTLSFKPHTAEMPEIPMYLDVLMSQDLDLRFGDNDIGIGEEKFIVCSLLGMPELEKLFKGFNSVSYRHVRRMLCVNKIQADKLTKKYINGWCANRRYVKKGLMEGLTEGSFCGCYSEYFIFLFDDDNYKNFSEFMVKLLEKMQVCFRIESFRFKDIWWGSLPGIFRADVQYPIVYFQNLGELLQKSTKEEIVVEEADPNAITVLRHLQGRNFGV